MNAVRRGIGDDLTKRVLVDYGHPRSLVALVAAVDAYRGRPDPELPVMASQ